MTDRKRAVVVLNPAARGRTAEERFDNVRGLLAERFNYKLVTTDQEGDWRNVVRRSATHGDAEVFVAAGGDGTVNALANTLLNCGRSLGNRSVILGAIGLGSSNDFHKPEWNGQGLPLRLDFERARPRDIVVTQYSESNGARRQRIFLASASLGLAAKANDFFNRGDPVLRLLKGSPSGLAISYAVLRTIVRHQNLAVTLRWPLEERSVAIASVSVLKTPFLSGKLRLDTAVAVDDGQLAISLFSAMGRLELARTLLALRRGKILGRARVESWKTPWLSLDLDHDEELEMDGEVVLVRQVRFEVKPRELMVCGI